MPQGNKKMPSGFLLCLLGVGAIATFVWDNKVPERTWPETFTVLDTIFYNIGNTWRRHRIKKSRMRCED